MKIDKNRIKRVLFITLSNIGDAILTTPVLESLMSVFPCARIDALVGPGVLGVFEKNVKISKCFIYDKHSRLFEKYRLMKKLRKINYDLVVDLKNTMIPIIIGPRYRTGFFNRKGVKSHKKQEHLGRLRALGLPVHNAGLNIPISDEDKQCVMGIIDERLNNERFIVVSAGAKSHVKRWPADNYARLCDRISYAFGYRTALIGQDGGLDDFDSDRVVVNHVLKAARSKPVDLVGKTNIRELSFLIEKADLLVTNDSAPLHVASAVNTPSVAVFGPTDEVKYGPLSEGSVVVRKTLDCAPCEKPRCRYNYECLRGIDVERVFTQVKRVLKNNQLIRKENTKLKTLNSK